VVATKKQSIIDVDGMQDVDDYNKYQKMGLFMGFAKISAIYV
jgi:hypothetical protein